MFARDEHGKKLMHHFQGYGEFELVDAPARNFRVNACSQRRAGRIGAGTTAVSIATSQGRFSLALPAGGAAAVLRFNGGAIRAGSHGGVKVTNSGDGETRFGFPGGEAVSVYERRYTFTDGVLGSNPAKARILDVQVSLPGAQYCGKVKGLCGCFDPDSSSSAWCDAAGKTVAPWQGLWSKGAAAAFAQALGNTYQPANSLFALDGISCDGAEPEPEPALALPSHLFELCPSLEQKAKAQCPKGTFRDWCLVGAGLSCQDLSIENARDTAALFGGRWGDAGNAPRTTPPSVPATASSSSAAAASQQILNKDTTLADLF